MIQSAGQDATNLNNSFGNLSAERAEALAYYLSPSEETVESCSVYSLWPEEKFLIQRHWKAVERIADLACGMGRTTLCLHEMGFSVAGFDLSAPLIEAAKRRFPYLDLRPASFTSIPEPDASFSHVLISGNAIDLAYPEPERERALRECARVLKPGGVFIFSSHNLKSLHPFSPRYWRRPLWKLSHAAKALGQVAHIGTHARESGLHGLYLAPEETIRQTESAGFQFIELVGNQMSTSLAKNRYSSIYIHYAFRKV